jgi:membrane-associated protein
MELLRQLVDIFLHLDKYLNEQATYLGPWLYLILFAIVFCETGLVVTPFLPGDSLLFAVGALAASRDSSLNISWLLMLLTIAAVAGDAVNYTIGYHVGPKVFRSDTSVLFNKKHLLRTQEFYERYGGKTIILARFIPIIRTFAPFVAGIGRMRYRQFAAFNVIGGVAWVCAFLLGGFFAADIPGVKDNFHIIIVAIIVISVMPGVVEYLLARRRAQRTRTPLPAADVPSPAEIPPGVQGQALAVIYPATAPARGASPSPATLTAPPSVQVIHVAPAPPPELSLVEVVADRVRGVFDTARSGMYPGAAAGVVCGILFALWGVIHRGVFINFVAVGVFGFVLWSLAGMFVGAGVGIAVGAVLGTVKAVKPRRTTTPQ